MYKIREKISAFVRDDQGLTMTEYAVAGSLVTLAAVVAFTALGEAIANAINEIVNIID